MIRSESFNRLIQNIVEENKVIQRNHSKTKVTDEEGVVKRNISR